MSRFVNDNLPAHDTQGLDMVRRDWCNLSRDVGNYVLQEILSRESREDLVAACHDFLRQVQGTFSLLDCVDEFSL